MADGVINIPIQDLKDTLQGLADIRDRIEERTGLQRVGNEGHVGDDKLIGAVNSFDEAWDKGHDRVQENVDAFKGSAQGVVDNFTTADDETAGKLP
ncbi:hypothetical protein HRW16_30270 [Streptomyces lunaelactis]|uniref:hypothetical protein n=1 Tax=Streptomyces lunaelactis TaxID=1535768 RepID=UPI0015854795|nr:hypothetical protein [Streptomyces lunaelactis]NUK38369.1 hypothetical protein [Streptomyces lunaelactis]NUK45402.1 hypothetical protein [Streptomyces lunaelactis]NUK61474.1 hypothetical protein [Streptomyces lunaelactis]NUK96039.1 hypothetical protein [Streptomyces lunaelactis]NUL33908.1 hypothetical protein [Streptomyces lunaelactis]